MSSGQMDRPPTDEQIRKIRELSEKVLGHADRLFSEIAPPESSAEASLMLGALHKVNNQMRPIAGAETSMVAMIEDIKAAEYDEDPAPYHKELPKVERPDTTPIDRSQLDELTEEPEAEEVHIPELQRTCSDCGETKPITEFDPWARGYRKACRQCETGDVSEHQEHQEDAEVEDVDATNEELDDAGTVHEGVITKVESHYTPRHQHFAVCPGCGADLMTAAIVDIAYTFATCECGKPEYPHLVEQLWHRNELAGQEPLSDPIESTPAQQDWLADVMRRFLQYEQWQEADLDRLRSALVDAGIFEDPSDWAKRKEALIEQGRQEAIEQFAEGVVASAEMTILESQNGYRDKYVELLLQEAKESVRGPLQDTLLDRIERLLGLSEQETS